jgi:hypothetical protein
VREDENGGQLHQRREPDGGARVVAEDEERRAERPQLGQRQPVDDRRHGVLANAEMQVLPAGLPAWKSPAPGKSTGLVRRPEVGRAAQEPGDVLRQHVQHLARGVAPGDALGIGGKDGQVAIPSRGQFAPLHLVDLGRELGKLGPVGGEKLPSIPRRLGAARADARAKCS